MTTKLSVCKSASCKSLGSPSLIRDLEELCDESSGCQAVNGMCLDHCGRGPNVQVQSRSGNKVIEGVKTFKDIRNLLEKTAGAKVKKLDWQIGEIKYEARRAKGPDRLAKVEKGLKALGGEDKASKEPRLAASLLAFRAEETLRNGGDLEAVVKDAQRAYALWKGYAPAHLASAIALFRLGQADEARQEMLRLEDAPFGTPAAEDRRTLMKEAEKHPPKEAEKPKEEAKPEVPAKEPTPEPAPKPKPAAAAPKAKPKAKTKPKAAPKAEAASAGSSDANSSSAKAATEAAPLISPPGSAQPVPVPTPAVDEDDAFSSIPMSRVMTYLSTVPDSVERSPGANSSMNSTGFHMLSEFESEGPQEERSLVYGAEPRSAVLDRRKMHPKGRRWIVSL